MSGVAAVGGNADVGIGNVVGSNMANLTLVLGLAALVRPVAVDSTAIRRKVPVTFAAMALSQCLSNAGLAGSRHSRWWWVWPLRSR